MKLRSDRKEVSYMTKEKSKKIEWMDIIQKYAVIIVWIILFITFSIMMPDTFCSWTNVRTMLGSQAVLVICAMAVLVPIIGGDFDMSVAATVTLVNIVIAKLNVQMGMPIVAAILIGLLIGAAIGAINGLIITKFNIEPFIVTMGMQTLLAGICLMVSQTSITGVAQGLKDYVYVKRILSISPSFFYALIICLILAYVFEKTSIGKKVLIVGRNRQVAQLSGINVNKTRLLCFITSGVISAIAGIVYTGILGGGNPTAGLSYMLPAFAAVYLGSTCLKPGRFNAFGTIIAVYFLATGTNGLSLQGIQSYIQNIFYGGALIVAVIFSVIVRRMKEKKEMKEAKLQRELEEKSLMEKLQTKEKVVSVT